MELAIQEENPAGVGLPRVQLRIIFSHCLLSYGGFVVRSPLPVHRKDENLCEQLFWPKLFRNAGILAGIYLILAGKDAGVPIDLF